MHPLSELEISIPLYCKRQTQKAGKICEDIAAIIQLNITDIYNYFNQNTAEYTYFSQSHAKFTKTLGYKRHLITLKRIEIIQCLFLDHNKIKLEMIVRRMIENSPNLWILNNVLPNSTWVKDEISREIKNIL